MKKSRLVAAILAFFTGTFGIHKFYLNRPGQGILYFLIFLFTWRFKFAITSVLGMIDAVRILLMSEEQFDAVYGEGTGGFQRNKKRATSQRRENPRRAQNQRSAPSRRFERERVRPKRKEYPKNNPFKQSGIRKFKDFDIGGAIEDFLKALKSSPYDPAVHFNLACSYSLNEQGDEAFYHLSQAVQNGFNDTEKIESHEALAFLRIQQGFGDFRENGYRKVSGKSAQIAAPQKRGNLLDEDVLLKQLNKLGELRDKGLLTQKEFIEQKRRLMD